MGVLTQRDVIHYWLIFTTSGFVISMLIGNHQSVANGKWTINT